MSRDLIGKKVVILRDPDVSFSLWGCKGTVTRIDTLENVPVVKTEQKAGDDTRWMFFHIAPTALAEIKEDAPDAPADTVCEDPPVAVPGYVTVTVREDLIVSCSDRQDEEKPPLRRMIPLSSIESVSAREDGTSWIHLKDVVPCAPMYKPPLHVTEDFDEISRRMRTAAIGEDIVI